MFLHLLVVPRLGGLARAAATLAELWDFCHIFQLGGEEDRAYHSRPAAAGTIVRLPLEFPGRWNSPDIRKTHQLVC